MGRLLPSRQGRSIPSQKFEKGSYLAMGVHRMLRRYGSALVVVLSLVVSLQAETSLSARIANIRIDNFGRINDNYYRGAQPDDQDYADLAAFGVKTVIDL